MPHAQMQRLWIFLGAVAAALLLVVGWFMFISPQRDQTSSVNSQVSSVRAQNARLQARIRQLQSENVDLAKYQAEVRQAELALPDSSGLPDFLRTLQSIGNATQTVVTSLTVGAPTNLTTVAAATPTATKSAASSATSSSATKTPAPGGVGQVFQLPISAAVTGSYAQLDEFLSQLQSVQPRAVLITQLSQTSPAGKASATSTTLSLTMQAFVAPSSAAESAQLAAAAAQAGK